MPTISAFFGIIIRMHHDDHAPPHFHAHYAEHSATIDIRSLQVLSGSLPRRTLALTLEWAHGHREELQQNWEKARRREALSAIAPLE